MSRFSEVFKALRKANGYTQEELADALGINRSRIGMYETDRREPDFETTEQIADFFNVDVDYLLGRTNKTTMLPESAAHGELPRFANIMPVVKRSIPLLGEIACGEPIFCNEDRESYIAAGTDVRADFCLKARGDSMTGARIMDGDVVFIQKDTELVNGGIYAVEIDDEATLKRVYYDEAAQELRLLAENPKYPTMVYSGERLAHVHVLGKAIAFQSDVI